MLVPLKCFFRGPVIVLLLVPDSSAPLSLFVVVAGKGSPLRGHQDSQQCLRMLVGACPCFQTPAPSCGFQIPWDLGAFWAASCTLKQLWEPTPSTCWSAPSVYYCIPRRSWSQMDLKMNTLLSLLASSQPVSYYKTLTESFYNEYFKHWGTNQSSTGSLFTASRAWLGALKKREVKPRS